MGEGRGSKVSVRLLGSLRLAEDGRELPLPASRKTRALFVYLLLSGRPVRRERLCELFFDIPDDPRAALRWSLTKIRRMLGPSADALIADRELVALDAEAFATDEAQLRGKSLAARAEASMEAPLPGLDLPGLDAYAAWLAAARAVIDRRRTVALRLAARDPALTEAQRERYAQEAEAIAGAEDGEAEAPPPEGAATLGQQIRYCFAADGVRIAYACTGAGPPLVKAANWLNHLELDWTGPVWGRLFEELGRRHQLVRYDERGNGCSDWAVDDLGFEAFVADLETVVDTLGLERFDLFGISQGCAVSVAYSARHPERVSRLVLLGGYSAGWRHVADADEAARREAMITLAGHGWGQDNPAYRQLFSQTFMPSATHEELDWFNDFQRQTATADNAVRFLDTFSRIDVRGLLGRVKCPTLVLHARDDQRVPILHGVELAASIPGASMVTLDSDNHIPLSREPATARIIECVEAFLRG